MPTAFPRIGGSRLPVRTTVRLNLGEDALPNSRFYSFFLRTVTLIVLGMSFLVLGAEAELRVMTYKASPSLEGKQNQFTLRLQGTALELTDSQTGVVLIAQPLTATRGIE